MSFSLAEPVSSPVSARVSAFPFTLTVMAANSPCLGAGLRLLSESLHDSNVNAVTETAKRFLNFIIKVLLSYWENDLYTPLGSFLFDIFIYVFVKHLDTGTRTE